MQNGGQGPVLSWNQGQNNRLKFLKRSLSLTFRGNFLPINSSKALELPDWSFSNGAGWQPIGNELVDFCRGLE